MTTAPKAIQRYLGSEIRGNSTEQQWCKHTDVAALEAELARLRKIEAAAVLRP